MQNCRIFPWNNGKNEKMQNRTWWIRFGHFPFQCIFKFLLRSNCYQISIIISILQRKRKKIRGNWKMQKNNLNKEKQNQFVKNANEKFTLILNKSGKSSNNFFKVLCKLSKFKSFPFNENSLSFVEYLLFTTISFNLSDDVWTVDVILSQNFRDNELLKHIFLNFTKGLNSIELVKSNIWLFISYSILPTQNSITMTDRQDWGEGKNKRTFQTLWSLSS